MVTNPSIFISVRGGVVQGVLVKGVPTNVEVVVHDYDDLAQSRHEGETEDEAEVRVYGNDWDSLRAVCDAVY